MSGISVETKPAKAAEHTVRLTLSDEEVQDLYDGLPDSPKSPVARHLLRELGVLRRAVKDPVEP